MTFEQYKNRYNSAYAKQAEQLNLLDPAYSDEQLEEAYKLYTDWTLWYHRAFKPGTLAQTNVLYTDYQITAAVDWEWDTNAMQIAERFFDKAEMKTYLRNNPTALKDVMHNYYEEERRNGRLDRKVHRGRQ